MAIFTVNRHEELWFNQIQQQFQLFLAAVPVDMDLGYLIVQNCSPLLEKGQKTMDGGRWIGYRPFVVRPSVSVLSKAKRLGLHQQQQHHHGRFSYNAVGEIGGHMHPGSGLGLHFVVPQGQLGLSLQKVEDGRLGSGVLR